MTDKEGDQPVTSQPSLPLDSISECTFFQQNIYSARFPPFLMTNFIRPPLNSCDKPIHNSEIPFDSSELGWEGLVPLN